MLQGAGMFTLINMCFCWVNVRQMGEHASTIWTIVSRFICEKLSESPKGCECGNHHLYQFLGNLYMTSCVLLFAGPWRKLKWWKEICAKLGSRVASLFGSLQHDCLLFADFRRTTRAELRRHHLLVASHFWFQGVKSNQKSQSLKYFEMITYK